MLGLGLLEFQELIHQDLALLLILLFLQLFDLSFISLQSLFQHPNQWEVPILNQLREALIIDRRAVQHVQVPALGGRLLAVREFLALQHIEDVDELAQDIHGHWGRDDDERDVYLREVLGTERDHLVLHVAVGLLPKAVEDEAHEPGVQLLVRLLCPEVDARRVHRDVGVRVVPPDHAELHAVCLGQGLCVGGGGGELLGADLDSVLALVRALQDAQVVYVGCVLDDVPYEKPHNLLLLRHLGVCHAHKVHVLT